MSFSVSGLRGGVSYTQHRSIPQSFWQTLASGDEVEIEKRTIVAPAPRTLTLVVNNQCNLHCRHCYLQVEQLAEPELTSEEWERLIESISRQPGIDLVSLVGKEVLLGPKGIHILDLFSQAFRGRSDAPRLGLVTNGTLTHRALDRIESSCLDYLDISVDGAEEEHDAIRGSGSFAAMARNLPPLRARFDGCLFGCLTLQQVNLSKLDRALICLSGLGFSTLGIGFAQTLPYNDSTLGLASHDYERFFAALSDFGDLPLPQPLTLLTELDLTNFQALIAFLRSGWFEPDKVFVDSRGEFVQECNLKNGLRLQFRLNFWPSLVGRSARITAEGLYLAGDDTLNTRLYAIRALGRAREASLDFAKLHNDASNHRRLAHILTEYRTHYLPSLSMALLESATFDLPQRSPGRIAPAVGLEASV